MNDRKNILTGTVASRRCPLCGHHEVGLMTQDGEFYALRQGMEVHIHGVPEPDPLASEQKPVPFEKIAPQEDAEDCIPWTPVPVLSQKPLRMKYAVRIKTDQAQEMSPEIYRLAYLEKLKNLIEKEVCVPLPVILDRFFTAPHLASGDPRQVAEAMWKELKEMREPVRRVEEWLMNREPSIFAEDLEGTDTVGEISGKNNEGEEILKELEELSLEDFLAML